MANENEVEVFCTECLMPKKEMPAGDHKFCPACNGELAIFDGKEEFPQLEDNMYRGVFNPVERAIAEMLMPGPRTITTTARVVEDKNALPML